MGLLERALKRSGWRVLRELGRSATPTLLIMDAQSVKNSDSADETGYDTGKKVPDIKRHIAVDTQGLPYAVAVSASRRP